MCKPPRDWDMNFDSFEVLTFDCYGTLIDWETGLLKSIGEVASNHNVTVTDGKTLELFAEIEAKVEEGPFLKYRIVLERVLASSHPKSRVFRSAFY